jgi:hypothetical protein
MREFLTVAWPLVPALILGALAAILLHRAAAAAEEDPAELWYQAFPGRSATAADDQRATATPGWERPVRAAGSRS